MVAISVKDSNCCEVIGAAEGLTESSECRRDSVMAETQGASWGQNVYRRQGRQDCRLYRGGLLRCRLLVMCRALYRNVLVKASRPKHPRVAAMLKTIRAMESRDAVEAAALEVASEHERFKLKEATKVVRHDCEQTVIYTRLPRDH